MADSICWCWLPAGASRQRGNEPSQALRASSPEGRAKAVEGALLASPFERRPPAGGRCRVATKRGQGVTEGDGEGAPAPLRGAAAAAAEGPSNRRSEKKMRLAKRLAFFRFDFSFGIIKGEQPLIRGSSASKSLALFWFSFVRQKRTNSARLQHIEIAATLPR